MVNGTIGKQMVDTLVESASNVEVRPIFLIFSNTNEAISLMELWYSTLARIMIYVVINTHFKSQLSEKKNLWCF